MATLKEVQDCELEMLKEIADICEKHNIDYYLAFGTFLGAVRHQGFIPWDDDIDIMVDYKDLRKLKKYAKKELDSKYFWQDNRTDRGSPTLYVKIRNSNTLMFGSRTKPEVEKMKKTHNGIWIDIMPMFWAAKNEKLLRIQTKCILKYQYYVMEQRKLETLKGNHFYSTIIMKSKEVLLNRFVGYLYFLFMLLLQSKKSKSFIHFGFYSIGYLKDFKKTYDIVKKCLLPKDLVDKKAVYPFEQYKFTSFEDYDRYLKINYGDDYMVPIKTSHVADYSTVIISDNPININ